jgi:hypothetical protein
VSGFGRPRAGMASVLQRQRVPGRETTRGFAAELGHPVEVLLIYRAAYAVATSNVFTPDGSDGHFRWCVAQLTRAEVIAALGLAR